MPPDVLF